MICPSRGIWRFRAIRTLRGSAIKQRSPVWNFGFQCNERYLKWDESAQARLLKLHCAEYLGWSLDKVDVELRQLIAVLPGLTVRLERIKATLLVSLLTDQNRVADNLLALRSFFPDVDAGALVLRFPELLTKMSADDIAAQAEHLRKHLPDVQKIDHLITDEPRLLRVDVAALLAEVERLMPDRNAQQFLARDPSSLMDMSSQGLRPSLEDEPGLQRLPYHSKG